MYPSPPFSAHLKSCVELWGTAWVSSGPMLVQVACMAQVEADSTLLGPASFTLFLEVLHSNICSLEIRGELMPMGLLLTRVDWKLMENCFPL